MKKGSNTISSILKGSIVIDTIKKGLITVYEAWKELLVSGIPPLTLLKSKQDNLVDYKIYGDSIQESENFFDASTTTLTENLYLSNTGAEVSNANWRITDYIEVDGYSFTITNVGGQAPSICAYDENKNFITGKKYGTNGATEKSSVVISSTTLIKYIRFSVYKPWILDGDINDITLSINPTPDTPVEIESLGNVTKNLVDFSLNNLELIKYNNNTSNNTRYGVDMGILPAGDYTISFDLVDEEDIPLYIYIRRKSTDSWTTVASLTTDSLNYKEYTFSTDGTYNYYMFIASNAFNTLELASEQWLKMKNIQLERGTEKTSYVPHIEIPIVVKDENGEIINRYSIYSNTPLRRINEHADYIDLKKQKIIRNITRAKIRNMGFALLSSGTSYRFETTGTTYVQNNKLFTGEDSRNLMCESLRVTDYSNNDNETISERTNLNYIKIRTQKYTTVSELYAGIGDSNVYFVLAEPIEEDIELPNISLNKGTNIIEIDTTIQPSNVEVVYLGKGG